MLVTFGTRYLVFYNPSPPRMFLPLDLLSEYRIQHAAIGPLYATSNYSTWIFCRGVSGFATDCPGDVWCRGLTTCLLHVGPPFGNRFLNTSWATSLTYWIVYLHFFVFWHMQLYVWIHHIIFWLYLYFLNILYFSKYSCTNIFHRRSLCTFYSIRPLFRNIILMVQNQPISFWHSNNDVVKWYRFPTKYSCLVHFQCGEANDVIEAWIICDQFCLNLLWISSPIDIGDW